MTNDFPIHTDPDSRNAVARRIVEVTDEDESLFPEFIEIDFAPEARRQLLKEKRKCSSRKVGHRSATNIPHCRQQTSAPNYPSKRGDELTRADHGRKFRRAADLP